jgi:hypothetical protein
MDVAPRIRQDHSRASYFGGRTPEDGRIDWRQPAEQIYNLIRAVTHPFPGAFTRWRDKKIFLWSSTVDVDYTGPTLPPGKVWWNCGYVCASARGTAFYWCRRRLENTAEATGDEQQSFS